MASPRQTYLVVTGPNAAQLEQFAPGQTPPGVNYRPGSLGSAILLGTSPAQVNRNIARAAKTLGVSNPTKVPSLSTSVGIISSEFFGFGSGLFAPGAEAAAVGAEGAATTADAAATGAGAGGGAGAAENAAKNFFKKTSHSISDTTAFLGFIAYLFHPRNLLRAVEFVFGAVLMMFGFWAAIQARGESREGFETGEIALTRSGVGRVAAAMGRAARGQGGSVESAPHRTRRSALRQRYTREQTVRRRHLSKPAGHHRRGKGEGGTGA